MPVFLRNKAARLGHARPLEPDAEKPNHITAHERVGAKRQKSYEMVYYRMRPNSYVSVAWVILAAAALAGCGSSTPSNQPKPSGLKKRVLLTNQQQNVINLLDAQKDVVSAKSFGATSPTRIITAGGQTVALDSTLPNFNIIDNTKEQVTFTPGLTDVPFDVALTPDGKIAFLAERNSSVIQFATTADGAVNPSSIFIPTPRRLVMSPNGTRLLVFTDPQAAVTNSFFVIDPVNKTLVKVTSPNLDQPITAVFGSSDDQAFILNCGPECGGTTASVAVANFSGVFAAPAVPPTVAAPINLQGGGATVGLLNGSNLFVAGTPTTFPAIPCPLSHCGTLNVINTGSLTASAPVAITDGLHQKMAFVNNRVYVGASSCTVDPGTAPNTVRGCLSIFNTSTSGVVFPQQSSFRQNFDVTGLQPISNRNVIYVVEGGELDFFDTTTDAVAPGITQVDIVGKAIDVVQIDP
jgi:hypothetical protein